MLSVVSRVGYKPHAPTSQTLHQFPLPIGSHPDTSLITHRKELGLKSLYVNFGWTKSHHRRPVVHFREKSFKYNSIPVYHPIELIFKSLSFNLRLHVNYLPAWIVDCPLLTLTPWKGPRSCYSLSF